ncbi:glucose-6-phosphate dehydrogenase (NADP(+)) [Candidatus Peregrinibacteria bacterium]|nr:glucose-6-phosphate dehydrogenase (NADP(+)) [Candidatus Peregrinibacteria bacterium]
MPYKKTSRPFILTIFGASGDLAKLKIFPALYRLMEEEKLPDEFYIIGYARTKMSHKEFQDFFIESIRASKKIKSEKLIRDLVQRVFYFTGNYKDLNDFKKYAAFVKKIVKKRMTHIAYFSVPPVAFRDIIENLGKSFDTNHDDLRLIIEKPFGTDRHSARELFHFAARYFHDEKLYLLDHYLGKTAVQSLVHLRHSNSIINMVMKGTGIANIQITAFEDIGIENRVGYFEQVGSLNDMVQSHLLQMLALVTMSIPITEHAKSLHREKYNILSALQFPLSKKNVVLGQYESYRSLPGVPKNSKTNTFAALRLFIDRESWYKVPIYIRTGKMLHEKHTFITVEFKKYPFQSSKEPPNRFIIEVSPEEKMIIKLINKHGRISEYQDITTSEKIGCGTEECLPEHAVLLLDVIRGNRLHFLSFPEIIASWRVIDSITRFIAERNIPVEKYRDGSEGPLDQNFMTKMDGYEWFDYHD